MYFKLISQYMARDSAE